jgi:hypothetical protein
MHWNKKTGPASFVLRYQSLAGLPEDARICSPIREAVFRGLLKSTLTFWEINQPPPQVPVYLRWFGDKILAQNRAYAVQIIRPFHFRVTGSGCFHCQGSNAGARKSVK